MAGANRGKMMDAPRPLVTKQVDNDLYEVGDFIRSREIHRDRPPEYGLCSSCQHLAYRKSKLLDVEVWCSNKPYQYSPKLLPNRHDAVVNCTGFYPAGQMDLRAMNNIAIPIEGKRKPIGF